MIRGSTTEARTLAIFAQIFVLNYFCAFKVCQCQSLTRSSHSGLNASDNTLANDYIRNVYKKHYLSWLTSWKPYCTKMVLYKVLAV